VWDVNKAVIVALQAATSRGPAQNTLRDVMMIVTFRVRGTRYWQLFTCFVGKQKQKQNWTFS
jgi:hypothetical protein